MDLSFELEPFQILTLHNTTDGYYLLLNILVHVVPIILYLLFFFTLTQCEMMVQRSVRRKEKNQSGLPTHSFKNKWGKKGRFHIYGPQRYPRMKWSPVSHFIWKTLGSVIYVDSLLKWPRTRVGYRMVLKRVSSWVLSFYSPEQPIHSHTKLEAWNEHGSIAKGIGNLEWESLDSSWSSVIHFKWLDIG